MEGSPLEVVQVAVARVSNGTNQMQGFNGHAYCGSFGCSSCIYKALLVSILAFVLRSGFLVSIWIVSGSFSSVVNYRGRFSELRIRLVLAFLYSARSQYIDLVPHVCLSTVPYSTVPIRNAKMNRVCV